MGAVQPYDEAFSDVRDVVTPRHHDATGPSGGAL
jgi:hypothetical protein